MQDLVIMGELLVEIMRDRPDASLSKTGIFLGPFPSGAPAICADTAARLGCKTAIIGSVGRDDFGKCLIDRLQSDGVDTKWVHESGSRSTGVAFVTYFSDGSRKYIFHMGNSAAVEAKVPKDFNGAKYMHIMGCSLMADEMFACEILDLMRAAIDRGAKLTFDPNIRRELASGAATRNMIRNVMENTIVFLPGTEELLFIANETDVQSAVRKCFEFPKMELVVLKRGSQGCMICDRTGDLKTINAYTVDQVDATGAGDCFDGAFLAGLCQGKNVEEAARMGAAAGALNAAAFGPMEGKINPASISEMVCGAHIK